MSPSDRPNLRAVQEPRMDPQSTVSLRSLVAPESLLG
jgi:hypothetical protein